MPPLAKSVSLSAPPRSVSLPSLPLRTSCPAAPKRMSFPKPPLRLSAPWPPFKLSSSSPPKKVSDPRPPMIVSSPPSPRMTASSCKLDRSNVSFSSLPVMLRVDGVRRPTKLSAELNTVVPPVRNVRPATSFSLVTSLRIPC